MTKVELAIIAAIVVILATLTYITVAAPDTKCVGGYLFSNPIYYQSPQQILDERGNGIKCGKETAMEDGGR